MRKFVARLGLDRSLMLLAGGLSLLLVLLLLVGWIWAIRLPPAPMIMPDPQALAPVPIILPEASSIVDVSGVANNSELIDGAIEGEGDGIDQMTEAADPGQPESIGITSRPLFWEGRRPVTEEQIASEVPDRQRKDELAQVRLIGVYFAGPGSGIIFEHKGERQRLRLQDELLGWRLEKLSAGEAVFGRDDGKQKTLQLEHADSAKYTATAKRAAGKASAAEAQDTGQ